MTETVMETKKATKSKKIKTPDVYAKAFKIKSSHDRGIYFSKNRYHDDAIKCYTEALMDNPRCSNTYICRADEYDEIMEKDKAIDDYKMSISINTTSGYPYFKIGILYCDKNEYRNAIKFLMKAIKREYRLPEAHYYRAKAYSAIGDRKSALADYKMAAEQGHSEAQQLLLSSTMDNIDEETAVKDDTVDSKVPGEPTIALSEVATGGFENGDDDHTEVAEVEHQETQQFSKKASVRNFNEDAKVVYLSTDSLTPRKPIIRHSDTDRLAIELNIAEKGILTPFIVIKTKKGTYDILNGNVRYWIALDKNIKEVPCIIIEEMNEDEKEEYIVTEMLAHRHLNMAQKALLAIRYVLPKEVELALKRRNESRKVRVTKESEMATRDSQHAGADLALSSTTLPAQYGKATDITAEKCAMPRDILRKSFRIYKRDPEMLEKAANENIPIGEVYKKMFGAKPESMPEQQASEEIDGHVDMQTESTLLLEQALIKCNLRIDRGNPNDVATISTQAADANVLVGSDIQDASSPMFADVRDENTPEDNATQNKPAPILAKEENENTTIDGEMPETPIHILCEVAKNASDRKDADKPAAVSDIQGKKISMCIEDVKESFKTLMDEAIKLEENSSILMITRNEIVSSLTEFEEYASSGIEDLRKLIEKLSQYEKMTRTA
ncbi:MAG: ParB N-terminal domain-containing protein [Nitrospirae bacterium]|nr:ParB N-terminal domain-containing protein [Nitrospirota bacterium]